jgi:hypothetical protein
VNRAKSPASAIWILKPKSNLSRISTQWKHLRVKCYFSRRLAAEWMEEADYGIYV